MSLHYCFPLQEGTQLSTHVKWKNISYYDLSQQSHSIEKVSLLSWLKYDRVIQHGWNHIDLSTVRGSKHGQIHKVVMQSSILSRNIQQLCCVLCFLINTKWRNIHGLVGFLVAKRGWGYSH